MTSRTRPTVPRPLSASARTLLALTLPLALALSACAGADTADDGTSPTAAPASAGEVVTATDAWVKAAESGMTGAFAVLANTGDAEVTVVSATSEVSERMELHETVAGESGEMTMREIDGGFTLAAGASFTLEPGGSHLMLMGLTGPLEAGEEITLTLTFSDDSTLEITAPVKDYAGANETYEE